MVNSSPRFPSPLNTLGNSLRRLCSAVSILAANFSAVMAGRLSRFLLNFLTTVGRLLSLYSLVDKGPFELPYHLQRLSGRTI